MKKYDIAAYVWPAYTGDEPRTRIFWPEGIGEWQSVKNSVSKYPGDTWPRKPLWGYVNEADPYVMEMEIEAALEKIREIDRACCLYLRGMRFVPRPARSSAAVRIKKHGIRKNE